MRISSISNCFVRFDGASDVLHRQRHSVSRPRTHHQQIPRLQSLLEVRHGVMRKRNMHHRRHCSENGERGVVEMDNIITVIVRLFSFNFRKLKRVTDKQDRMAARRILAAKPHYKLDHVVKERYPTFQVRSCDRNHFCWVEGQFVCL